MPALIVFLWWYVTEFTDTTQTILPKISTVAERFGMMWEKGRIQNNLKVSLLRVLQGYVISAVPGVLLGTVMGISQTAKKKLQHTLTVIRQIGGKKLCLQWRDDVDPEVRH